MLNGRWGPYIAANDKNYKIPKGSKEARELTLDDCLTIIGSSEGTPQRNAASRKKVAVAAPVKSAKKAAKSTTKSTKSAAPKKAAAKKSTPTKKSNTKK